jgi:hypothetical protein
LLAQTRGYPLYDVAQAIFANEYVVYQHRDYPQQSRAIGPVERQLMTLVYEFIEDDFGAFVKLITYWPASGIEAKLYDREVQSS